MANDIRLPSGMLLKGVPAGTTRAQIIEKLRRNGHDVSELEATLDQPAQEVDQVDQNIQQPPGVRPGRLESGIRSLRQGLTFEFGDELTSALSALSSYPILAAQGQLGDQSLGDLFQSGLDIERGDIKAGREDFPVQSALAEIAGGLSTGGGGVKGISSLAPKISGRLAQFARANPVKAGAAVGSGSAGAFGLGEGEGGIPERVTSGLKGAGLGLIGGAGGGLLASKLSNAATRGAIPTSENLRKEAGKLYKEASSIGGQLKPQATRSLLNKIAQVVKPKTKVESRLQGENVVSRSIDDLMVDLKDGADFEELRSLEQVLGKMANDNVIAATGKLNSAGNTLKTAQKEVRKFIDEVAEDQLEGGKLAFDLKRAADQKWYSSLNLNEIFEDVGFSTLTK